ncbi:hypothetical protein ACO1O0_007825 [Amphichorda felina]
MKLALTFGSLGDIIQLSQLAIQLGRAVGVGCEAGAGTSAKEYQQVRDDLDVLVRMLMQVVATYQQHELSPSLQVLDDISRLVVDECTAHIQEALEHFRLRYGNSLGVGGSGKKIQDIAKRIEWSMREPQKLGVLRNKLHEGTQKLSLLMSLTAYKSARVDNATMLARIAEVEQLVSQAQIRQEETLQSLRTQKIENEERADRQMKKLGLIKQKLATQETENSNTLGVARDALQGITEVQNLLVQVSQNVINLQVAASNSTFLRPLDPTRGAPVVLEDSLGRRCYMACLPAASKARRAMIWFKGKITP